jgi:hypothetical protein
VVYPAFLVIGILWIITFPLSAILLSMVFRRSVTAAERSAIQE